MIDSDKQFEIQAFLDGELPGEEAREIAAWIARDPEAAALHAELKNTRRALVTAEQGVVVPETRDFYWSKICREIERLEPACPVQQSPSLWHGVSRWLWPVGVAAAVILMGMFVFQQTGGPNGATGTLTAAVSMDALTYRDEAASTTFVWFTEPAKNDVANDAADTRLN